MKPIAVNIYDFSKVIDTFKKESDRGAAVLGGSFLENYLAKFLRNQMIDDPSVDDLFNGFGPFSNYKQRVETAYAFGFINKVRKQDLIYIGKIRNHFAHHPLEASFNKSPVLDWCAKLSPKEVISAPDQTQNIEVDPRDNYLMAIGMCISEWHNSEFL